jgi:hypothetical protein
MIKSDVTLARDHPECWELFEVRQVNHLFLELLKDLVLEKWLLLFCLLGYQFIEIILDLR